MHGGSAGPFRTDTGPAGARRRTFSGVHLAAAVVAGAILAGLAAIAAVSVTSPATGVDGDAVLDCTARCGGHRHQRAVSRRTPPGVHGVGAGRNEAVDQTARLGDAAGGSRNGRSGVSILVGRLPIRRLLRRRRLKMVAIAGGDVKTICDAPEGRGGAWNQDDVILFAPNREGPLFRVPASGGVPARVTHVDRALHRAHLWPEFLPDGQHFFYLADSTRPEHHAIFAGGLDQSPAKRLIAVESNAAFDGAHAWPCAIARCWPNASRRAAWSWTKRSSPSPSRWFGSGIDHKGDFSASRTGVLTFRGGGTIQTRLNWLDRRGQPAGALDAGDAATTEPVLSPDGSRAAVSVFDADGETLASDLWLLDLVRGGRSLHLRGRRRVRTGLVARRHSGRLRVQQGWDSGSMPRSLQAGLAPRRCCCTPSIPSTLSRGRRMAGC